MSIRTAVIGSYPKVTETGLDNLPGVIDRWQRQLVDDQDLEQELQKVTRRVIREQEEHGLDVVSDGQIGWEDLNHAIVRSSEGLGRGTLRRFFDNNVYYRRLEWKNGLPAGPGAAQAGVSWKKSAAAEEFRFASGAAKKPVKVALPGPLTLVISTEPKPGWTREQFLSTYEGLLRKEVEQLEKSGAKEIQIDEPSLALGEPLLEQAVAAVNRIFDGIRARRWVAVYFQDVSAILPALSKLKVDVLALDLVSAHEKNPSMRTRVAEWLRGGGWKGEVALGLVDARNTKLENVQELKKQIAIFAAAVPADRLWLAPSCGLEFLPHEAAVKKLKVLREAAQDV